MRWHRNNPAHDDAAANDATRPWWDQAPTAVGAPAPSFDSVLSADGGAAGAGPASAVAPEPVAEPVAPAEPAAASGPVRRTVLGGLRGALRPLTAARGVPAVATPEAPVAEPAEQATALMPPAIPPSFAPQGEVYEQQDEAFVPQFAYDDAATTAVAEPVAFEQTVESALALVEPAAVRPYAEVDADATLVSDSLSAEVQAYAQGLEQGLAQDEAPASEDSSGDDVAWSETPDVGHGDYSENGEAFAEDEPVQAALETETEEQPADVVEQVAPVQEAVFADEQPADVEHDAPAAAEAEAEEAPAAVEQDVVDAVDVEAEPVAVAVDEAEPVAAVEAAPEDDAAPVVVHPLTWSIPVVGEDEDDHEPFEQLPHPHPDDIAIPQVEMSVSFGERIERLIAAAVTEADNTRADATAEAEQLIQNAKLDAEHLVAAAQRQAAEIVASTQRRCDDELAASQRTRAESEQVLADARQEADELRKRVRDEVAELRAEIDEHAQAMLARTHAETGRTLAAARAELEELTARKNELEEQMTSIRALLSDVAVDPLPDDSE